MADESHLELAVRNERAEIAFYEKEAKRSTKRATKTLFEILAAQEGHHIKLLEDIAHKSTQKDAWSTKIDRSGMPVDVVQVLDQLERLGGTTRQDIDDIEALEKAVSFEKKAEAFYSKLADDSTNEQEQMLFRTIAAFERDHLVWIETFLATLKEE